MKNLVVYYSLEGNTKLIAKTLAKEINADIIELIPKKEFPTKGFKKYFWGGKSAVFREKPILLNEEIDIGKYDNIFIGTPIWAGTYTPPINTFLEKYKIENKNIGLFVCYSGGRIDKCIKNVRNAIPNNNFIGEIDFIDPLQKNTEENLLKAKEWIKELNI